MSKYKIKMESDGTTQVYIDEKKQENILEIKFEQDTEHIPMLTIKKAIIPRIDELEIVDSEENSKIEVLDKEYFI